MAHPSARVRVGSFELDLRSGELRPAGADVAADRVILREQPFQVLRMLIEREGKIVTREEIKKRLWPNDTIVDFDHSINVAIGVLRRALGDAAANPRYIETLARRGYRLVANVEWLESTSAAAEADANEAAPFGDLTGRKVGQYRILEVLGGGGMGMVYKAEDLKLGRRVALKFLPVDLAGDTIALQRLQREAQTASALNHPNIFTIYDIEEYEGQSFIAMELLEGDTLQERLAALAPSPVPLRTLIDIAIQICVGLEAAHGKAIVHRDIKPANIFLTAHGAVKLLDFGVAKLVAGEDPAEPGLVESRPGNPGPPAGLTLPDAAVGTAGYMSPEQVRREALDGRSDLFSLGLVIYEMATGQRAFTGETAMAVQEAILTTTPPAVEAINTAVPPALASVVARAIEKDRDRRYQTASDMRQALESARADLMQPAARRLRRWLPAVAAVVAIASLSMWLLSQRVSKVTLAANDTIVLAHVTNATSDRVYDEALYTALRISLEQTPYLNVLADSKVRGTLTEIGLAANAPVTEEIALQICRRTGSKVAVAAAIADAGNRLRLELKGLDCQAGSTISLIRQEAASRNDVVATLGIAALQLRRELGEPAASVDKYNVTLQEATSSSPDALELLTLGYRRQLAGSSVDAISYYQRAIQTDQNLALAHAALSAAYGNVGEGRLSAAAGQRAFALRGRMTAPGRFNAESTYYHVAGDLESTCAVLAQWVDAFRHDLMARNNFAGCLANLGEPDRALGESREAARLLPSAFTYWMWIGRSLHGERMDEAEAALADARARGFDSPLLRDQQAFVAFLRNDESAMQQMWTWASDKPEAHLVIMGKAMGEAARGQFRAALRTQETATAMSARVKVDAMYAMEMALMRATVGLPPSEVATSTTKSHLRPRLLRTLLAARTGRIEEARRAADALRLEAPSDTIVQKFGLPLIEATVRLHLKDPAGAVAALEPAAKYNLSYTHSIFPALYSSYVRGTAYLQMHQFAAAAAEFQRVLAHPGLVGRWVYGPLARLQLARAQRGIGDETAALSSYKVFLDLWKGADADVPVYQDAKTEYDALRSRR